MVKNYLSFYTKVISFTVDPIKLLEIISVNPNDKKETSNETLHESFYESCANLRVLSESCAKSA